MVRCFSNCCLYAQICSEFACEPFKSRVLVPHSPLALLDVSPAGFQSQILWELVYLVKVPKAEVPNVGLRPLTPEGGPSRL